MNVIKNYTSTILLLLGILIGGVCGMIFGEDAAVVKPVGDIFMNFMYVLVVPIVCLSVSSAMCTMKRSNMAGRVLVNTLLVFLVMSVVLAVLSWLCILVYNPMTGVDSSAIQLNGTAELPDSGLSVGEMLVSTVSVPEFLQMFEKPHLLPLIIFSVVFGLATAVCGEKGKPVADFLEAGSNVVLKMMDYLMYLAPVCLGCYFAATIGSLGGQIVNGYLGAFVLYLVLTVIVYFGVNSVYIFLAGGKKLLKSYWRNILPPSLTAVGTSSSAACIPFNIEAAQNMGVPSSIASTVVPFGTNIHKDGSVVSSVVKIVFLMTSVKKSGPIQQTLNIIKHLDKSRFEPILVTMYDEDKEANAFDRTLFLLTMYSMLFTLLEISLSSSYERLTRPGLLFGWIYISRRISLTDRLTKLTMWILMLGLTFVNFYTNLFMGVGRGGTPLFQSVFLCMFQNNALF